MISIKPHHFVDIITSFGGGVENPEPHPYGHAVHSVTRKILQDPDVELKMNFGADDICMPCCHNVEGLCDDTIDTSYRPKAPKSKREYNLLLDRRWAKRLEIEEGDVLTARALCDRIRTHSGDINGIYLEMPLDRNEERKRKLQKGIARFLEEA